MCLDRLREMREMKMSLFWEYENARVIKHHDQYICPHCGSGLHEIPNDVYIEDHCGMCDVAITWEGITIKY